MPCFLDLLRGRLDRVAEQLDAAPDLVHRRFQELDCGSTAARRLLLQGATLLHVAAEFGDAEAAKLLLDRGADVNARATVDESDIGGQTPIFHAVSQNRDGFCGNAIAAGTGSRSFRSRETSRSLRTARRGGGNALRLGMRFCFQALKPGPLRCCVSEMWRNDSLSADFARVTGYSVVDDQTFQLQG